MLKTKRSSAKGLKKIHVQQMIAFAMTYLPQLDQPTLEKFAELVESEDNHGYISIKELSTKMNLMLKYIPKACPYSLETLAALLDVQIQNPKAASKLLKIGVFAGESGSAKKYAQARR